MWNCLELRNVGLVDCYHPRVSSHESRKVVKSQVGLMFHEYFHNVGFHTLSFCGTADLAVYLILKLIQTMALVHLKTCSSSDVFTSTSVKSIQITVICRLSGFRCYAKFHRKRRVTRRRGRCVVPESVSSDQGGFITIWGGGDGGGTGRVTPWQSRSRHHMTLAADRVLKDGGLLVFLNRSAWSTWQVT